MIIRPPTQPPLLMTSRGVSCTRHQYGKLVSTAINVTESQRYLRLLFGEKVTSYNISWWLAKSLAHAYMSPHLNMLIAKSACRVCTKIGGLSLLAYCTKLFWRLKSRLLVQQLVKAHNNKKHQTRSKWSIMKKIPPGHCDSPHKTPGMLKACLCRDVTMA